MPDVARKEAAAAAASETTFTLREHPYSYFHLRLLSLPTQSTQAALDEITLRQYLNSALTQFLGFTGGAISVDILKVEGPDSWIRVQREDGDTLMAALSQWTSASKGVSLRIVGRAAWLGGLQAKKGSEKEKLWSLEQ